MEKGICGETEAEAEVEARRGGGEAEARRGGGGGGAGGLLYRAMHGRALEDFFIGVNRKTIKKRINSGGVGLRER